MILESTKAQAHSGRKKHALRGTAYTMFRLPLSKALCKIVNMNIQTIETEYGALFGRDAIYLDKMEFLNSNADLKLKGEISGSSCSNEPEHNWISYEITFKSIFAISIFELDTWDASSEIPYASSFDELLDSPLIQGRFGKISDDCHHYIFSTYDYVFSVVCRQYILEYGGGRA